jgi:selenocysteine lyase/cysteine desulfurase
LILTEEFPLTQNQIWFNTAATGACPSSTMAIMAEYHEDIMSRLTGDGRSIMPIEKWQKRRANSKKLFADIIGVTKDEVAFVPNATIGVNTAFSMIPLQKGDNIVTTDLSFPMGAVVVNKQRKRNVEPRFIQNKNGKVDLDSFETTVDDNTKIVYVDQAAWFNGYLHDIKGISDITHDHGAFLVVDATQSVGVLSWDAKAWGVDFLATSTYKWMMGGPYQLRAGFLFIDENHIDSLEAPYAGDQTLEPERSIYNQEDGFDLYNYQPRKGIERLEVFPHSMNSYVAVENSLKVLLQHDLDRIENYVKSLGTRLINGLLEKGHKLQTPINENERIYVNFKVPRYKEVCNKLSDLKITVSSRVGGLRVSPHFYNTNDEIDIFLEKLNEITSRTN